MKILSTWSDGATRQFHDVDMGRDALAELEAWRTTDKAHTVRIEHDDDFGSSAWIVVLSRGKKRVHAVEWWGFDPDEPPPAQPEVLYVCFDVPPSDEFDANVGLKATILAAVDEARRQRNEAA